MKRLLFVILAALALFAGLSGCAKRPPATLTDITPNEVRDKYWLAGPDGDRFWQMVCRPEDQNIDKVDARLLFSSETGGQLYLEIQYRDGTPRYLERISFSYTLIQNELEITLDQVSYSFSCTAENVGYDTENRLYFTLILTDSQGSYSYFRAAQ